MMKGTDTVLTALSACLWRRLPAYALGDRSLRKRKHAARGRQAVQKQSHNPRMRWCRLRVKSRDHS